MAHTVSVPETEAAGLIAGAWLAGPAAPDPPAEPPGALVPLFVPQLATNRPRAATMAANRNGLPCAWPRQGAIDGSSDMSVLLCS